MQSGDNAGTSPVSEWPTGNWSSADVPASHSAPLVSARVPIGRSQSQREETLTGGWPQVGKDERPELPPGELPDVDERVTSPSAIGSTPSSPMSAVDGRNQRDRGIALVVAGLSHDLNNLLVGVLGNAELAQTAYLKGEDPASHLLAIRAAAERASALASSMVRFASDRRSNASSFDLSDLVGEMVMLARAGVSKSAQVVRGDNEAKQPLWGSNTLTGGTLDPLDSEPDQDESKAPLLVRGDSGQIGQVVLNLIINGADSLGPHGGEVHIAVEKVSELPESMILKPSHDSPEGFARLRVADTGSGITPELLPRIFEPFFSTKRQGRGLGLANCLEIISEHGGGLNVVSAAGQGTTFDVYLPLSAEVRSITIRAPEHAVAPEWRTSGRVLVIDDEPMVARLTAMVLEHVGLKATIEHTGVGAVERLAHSLTESEASQFRVCVLDLTMPNLSGQELLQQLKNHAPHLPVVLTSGFSEQQLRQRGVFSGFDGFLQKPFRMSAMVDVLRCLLEPDSDPEAGTGPLGPECRR